MKKSKQSIRTIRKKTESKTESKIEPKKGKYGEYSIEN